jgi:hypothetical protein
MEKVFILVGLEGQMAAPRMGAPILITADRQLWGRQSEA